MLPEKNQVKFRCSDRFLQRIKSQSIKREMTTQDLITAALKSYFQTPPEDSGGPDFITIVLSDDDKGTEESDWRGLWRKYIETMPREKVLLIVEVLKLDLLHYKSSRRQADLRKRREEREGKENPDVKTRTE